MQRDSPLPAETLSLLGDRGYRTRTIYNFGDVQIIYDDGGTVAAASDPRNRGVSRVIETAEVQPQQ